MRLPEKKENLALLLTDLLCLVTIITFIANCISDSNAINEMHRSRNTTTPLVTQNIIRYKALIDNTYLFKPDSAIIYSNKLISIYRRFKLHQEIYNTYLLVSEIALQRLKDKDKALFYYGEAEKLVLRHGRHWQQNAYHFITLGNLLETNDMIYKAKEAYLRAIQLARQANDTYTTSIALNNIALIFKASHNTDSARYYFYKSLTLSNKLHPLFVAQTYSDLGQMYSEMQMPDSVKTCIFRMQNAYNKIPLTVSSRCSKYPGLLGQILHNTHPIYLSTMKGIWHEACNDHKTAFLYYMQADSLFHKDKHAQHTAAFVYKIALACLKVRKRPLAMAYADSALGIATSEQCQEQIRIISQFLSVIKNDQHKGSEFIPKMEPLCSYCTNHSEKFQKNIEEARTLLIAQSFFPITLATQKHPHHIQLILLLIFILSCEFFILLTPNLSGIKQEITTASPNSPPESCNNAAPRTIAYSKFDVQFKRLMNETMIYKQKNISLPEISRLLGTNPNYLSGYINSQFNVNFTSYINTQRIQEACRILTEDQSHKLSMDQVAELSGFSSRRAFYDAFKKTTGHTPANYKKNSSSTQTSSWA